MKALVLEDVAAFAVREIETPAVGPRDVLIRVGAVGICGTDLHIFHGFSNYHRDEHGQAVSLRTAPQILGHEFCGTVEAIGKDVKKCRPGDRVIADQVLNCHSQHRDPICEYCDSGDSHQCAFGEELGITGQQGAFAEFVGVPETNIVVLPPGFSPENGALVEPLACVLHACDRMEEGRNRYEFEGLRPIRNILITGAGPSGLLFLQYLRNVKRFSGEIFVADVRPAKLALVAKLGGTPLDVGAGNLVAEIRRRTRGEMIHYLIEASGAGSVFDLLPLLLRHQGTFQFYGAGHSDRDVGCVGSFQYLEFHVITSSGASGGFEADGTPVIYRRSMEYLRDGLIDASSLLTHRYSQLSELQKAFEVDAANKDFVKGAWVPRP